MVREEYNGSIAEVNTNHLMVRGEYNGNIGEVLTQTI